MFKLTVYELHFNLKRFAKVAISEFELCNSEMAISIFNHSKEKEQLYDYDLFSAAYERCKLESYAPTRSSKAKLDAYLFFLATHLFNNLKRYDTSIEIKDIVFKELIQFGLQNRKQYFVITVPKNWYPF